MKNILFAALIMCALASGLAFGGQCTGGDKLNPQPLPPGRRHQYHSKHGHKHRHSTAHKGASCSSCTNKPK